MGGKSKGKRRKGKGKVQAAGGGGPTPGAASWRWGGGGADNEQGGQKKYGNLTPEDIEAQARELAAQMGLAYDDGSGEEDSAAEEEEEEEEEDEEEPKGNAKVKGRKRIMVNEDDGSDGDGNDERHNQKDMPKRKKKKKKCEEHAGRDSSGAEPSKKRMLGRSEPPGWLMLEDGDLRETAVKAPKKPAAMWKQLGRAQRLLRAARLALGHPPAPKDLGMCSELVSLLGQWLRPLLGPGVCHGTLEDLLSAKTCSSALQQAGASVEQLSRALPEAASSAGRLHDDDGDNDDDEEDEEEEGGNKEPNVPEAAANAWVRSVCSLDELFFQMHYAFRVAGPDAGIEPEGYLESVAPSGGLRRLLPRLPDPNDSKALKRSLGRIMGDGALSEVSMRGGCSAGANALLRIHWARLAEGAALFLRSGLSERIAGSPEWLSKQGSKAKGKNPQHCNKQYRQHAAGGRGAAPLPVVPLAAFLEQCFSVCFSPTLHGQSSSRDSASSP